MENKLSVVELYNPANAKSLSQDQVNAMKDLTVAELKALAAAYPNTSTTRPYLVLFDSRQETKRQVYPLSTWPSLYSLRKVGGTNHFSAFSFVSIFDQSKSATTVKASKPQDLTPDEAKEEIKQAATSEQDVTQDSKAPSAEADSSNSEKDLSAMSKEELRVKYKETVGSDAPANLTKASLIEAINAHKL